jgi:hypothetical protein
MERKKIATEIVIHHYGSGLAIASEILREFGRVVRTARPSSQELRRVA